MNDTLFEKLMELLIETGNMDTAEELLQLYQYDETIAFKESSKTLKKLNIGYTFDNEYIMTESEYVMFEGLLTNITNSIANMLDPNTLNNLEGIADKIESGQELEAEELMEVEKINNPSLMSKAGKYFGDILINAFISLGLFPLYLDVAGMVTGNEQMKLFIAIILISITLERKGAIQNKIKMSRELKKNPPITQK